ncbi:hypothetical protein PISMIDRAFT_671627 [Pisolithus microcarpus 441]|uniref:Uncharacterized protein n=1 Tax=Pisolithus microcarpus 441 TaxID=765257 RepID=A0A0D0A5J6_9AGAM|nr:hypothetical protein BKA83DRAFT_671627 [Pisolithus microcarpus]KIK29687.1 hypothetical protein PISMIDRAFT_671627 [Pisolithus microcarpus 441]
MPGCGQGCVQGSSVWWSLSIDVVDLVLAYLLLLRTSRIKQWLSHGPRDDLDTGTRASCSLSRFCIKPS